jgi:hypothetical protein
MPYRRGPPKGSHNRLKHGRYSATSIAQRRLVRSTIRSAKLALISAKIEMARSVRDRASIASEDTR